MRLPVFLDASFVVALGDEGDEHHRAAMAYWSRLTPISHRPITTEPMLYEVVAYFQRRGRHDLAVRYGSLLRDGLDIEFLRIDEATNELAWQYLARRHDKGYSLADCASFVVMTRMGLRDALTFDHHFAQAGFRMLPGP